MKGARLSAVGTLLLVAATAAAEPQVTVLQVPTAGMVRGEPYDVEPATTGNIAYINAWDPDDFRPGEGSYVLLEWRRSTGTFRHLSTLPMRAFKLLGVSPDGSTATYAMDDYVDENWTRWSSASGTRTNFSSRKPRWTNESVTPYVGFTPAGGAFFVMADNSVVNFPSPELFETVAGLNSDGIAFGSVSTSASQVVEVPFTWVPGESVRLLPQLPGQTRSVAVAVTDQGEVIVRPFPPGGYASVPHYRWTESGGYVQFASLPAHDDNHWSDRKLWSSSGRLYMAVNGFQSSVTWSQERGLESTSSYLTSRGVDLAAEGLTGIVYTGMKDDGRIFWGYAQRNNNQVAWFVTGVPLPCVADFNADGFVDFFDYDGYVVAFEAGNMSADTNSDGFLDFFDYDAFVEIFETGC